MDPNILHLVVAAALTLVGVIITALIWRTAQVKTVFWWAGASLVPIAVYLLGLAPATVGAYETLYRWAAALTFTPVVWTGVVLAGLAALLILGSRLIPSESRADRRATRAKTTGGTPASARGGRTPAPISARPAAAPTAPKARPGAAPEDGEFDEIAELLRKRGIN